MKERINILISGIGGQGIRTIANLLSKTFLQSGYYIYSTFNKTTRIIGGINSVKISIGIKEINYSEESIDILISLSNKILDRDRDLVVEGGLLILDGDKKFEDGVLTLPLEKLAKGSGSRQFINTVLLGAIMGIFKLDITSINNSFLREFAKKGVEVYNENLKAAQIGYKQTIDEGYLEYLEPALIENNLLITGSDSIVYAIVGSGCQTLFANPIPVARRFLDLMNEFSEEFPIICDASESDASAIFKGLGASYTGVKSMVVVSDSGFLHLCDGLAYSGMSEIPIVVTVIQSPGPSIGMPTKTEQNNLLSSIFSGNGEFARVIYAPGTHQECFSLTYKAFEISSNYNIPVIILLEQILAETVKNLPMFNLDDIRRPRDHFTRKQLTEVKEYKTYKVTNTGISPRLFPGQTDLPVKVNTFEHNDDGYISADAEIRIKQVNKRALKEESIMNEFIPPEFYGVEKFDILFVGWGASKNVIKRVVDLLRSEKKKVGALLFTQMYPINPKKIKKYFRRTKFIVNVENNSSAQFAKLLKMIGGIEFNLNILRYDGLPLTPEYILRKFKDAKK
ncbi:2-oxoacid:acceptor oxidoreductase family protein [Candidatus Dependentiae bacterium]|nr:2-oxoacid:acceptor oxidoreductase family protein [Candidatus Dependentiae bacterium]